MIKKFKEIKNLATYKRFGWDEKVYHQNNQPYEFSDINILYGRNYSGKTTLSRIIRAFEKGYEGMKQYYQNGLKTMVLRTRDSF